MTTTLISMPTPALGAAVPAAPIAIAAPVAMSAPIAMPAARPASARLRSVCVMPSSVELSVVDVPVSDGSWLRGRTFHGTAAYPTINAQAAKHGKAVDPPRGTSV